MVEILNIFLDFIFLFTVDIYSCHSSLKISVVLQMVRFFWVYPSRATGRLEIHLKHIQLQAVSVKRK